MKTEAIGMFRTLNYLLIAIINVYGKNATAHAALRVPLKVYTVREKLRDFWG